MSFLVDMPLSPALAAWLRDHGYEAVHAYDIGMASATDEILLDHARSNNFIVVIADMDYPRLLALAQESGPGSSFSGVEISAGNRRKHCLQGCWN